MTNHSNCKHESSKSARAKCRRMMRAETTEQTTQRLLATAPARALKSAQNASAADLAEYKRLVAEIESA